MINKIVLIGLITSLILSITFHLVYAADTFTISMDHKGAISKDLLEALFKKYLCDHLNMESSDIVVSKFNVFGNRNIPSGRLIIKIINEKGSDLKGYVKLLAYLIKKGKVKRKILLNGWVDIFENIVVAKRRIKKGQIIGRDDIYLSKINISRISDDYINDPELIIGKIARHNILKGRYIKRWMVEIPPVIKKGERVIILAENQFFKITAPGISLEDGLLGETIRVINEMSRKEIYARVISDSIVKVNF